MHDRLDGVGRVWVGRVWEAAGWDASCITTCKHFLRENKNRGRCTYDYVVCSGVGMIIVSVDWWRGHVGEVGHASRVAHFDAARTIDYVMRYAFPARSLAPGSSAAFRPCRAVCTPIKWQGCGFASPHLLFLLFLTLIFPSIHPWPLLDGSLAAHPRLSHLTSS
jgi:hypothetical protein